MLSKTTGLSTSRVRPKHPKVVGRGHAFALSLRVLFQLLVALYFAAGWAWADADSLPSCVDRVVGSSLLQGFNPDLINLSRLTKLNSGVYRVNSGGSGFVARFPSTTADTSRERFASAFINRFPGFVSPSVRQLNASQSRAIMSVVRRADPSAYNRLVESWLFGLAGTNDQNARLSLAIFYDLPSGKNVLKQFPLASGIRELLVYLSRPDLPYGPEGVVYARERINAMWLELSGDEQTNLVEDLKVLLPPTRAVAEGDYIRHLSDNIEILSSSEVQRLMILGVERLPMELSQQLSDYFVLYTILGIPDFHPGNWLWENGSTVVAIDLAHPPVAASELSNVDEPFSLPAQQYPFGQDNVGPEMREWMLANVSDGLRGALNSINARDLRTLARDSGYRFRPTELEDILGRIHYLLDR